LNARLALRVNLMSSRSFREVEHAFRALVPSVDFAGSTYRKTQLLVEANRIGVRLRSDNSELQVVMNGLDKFSAQAPSLKAACHGDVPDHASPPSALTS
jgi:hypothetical protein